MPQTLGPYELRGELGKGAMAVVWRAFDPNLEREVAIKEPVIPPGTDSATAAELGARFVREGKAAAKLNHPGVVTIYASDIYDGRPAIVMELIEGETLSDILDKGPLEPQSAIAVADQLLDAAGYAHSRGIVHRDIKPDNVFITDDGRVKLADFGIAHTGQTSTLTQAGTVMGTPGYMAPEQVTGSPVDARADIFAIGVILFEMLTGQNPFGATDGMAATTVMYRIVHEQVPEVSDDLLAGLPADVSAVLAAALAKDPDARFGSATAFRTALRGGPIEIGVPASTGVAQPASPVAGFAPAAGGPAVSSAGKSNWTPYIIVGAVGVLVIGALLVFAGGGTPSSGSVPIEPAAEQESASEPEVTAATGDDEPASPTSIDLSGRAEMDATSVLEENWIDYGPGNLVDGNPTTCWAEGVVGYGRGETFYFDFAEVLTVTRLEVLPGYDKDLDGWDRWWSNGRLQSVRVEFSDGSVEDVTFSDERKWHTVDISPREVDWLSVEIMTTYPARAGAHYAEDTSVSEFHVYGY